ncbi:T9SS type A sorting domain-containing protein [Empedobacter falsenii]|uniref:zinc-dependent metalloprotease n=1 Tax=Empedobacter falsenii TaxID=343874 RepID=UPI0025752E18|nr:zinc-dependent metalloprotease [Empedobacter falsenii]MDM1297762.1 T9SS type A sorting domain-containing protein [Empedobacter falsenii]MDM1317608.1 T9SS type A sorting domain-containing protein [Empedobacter falsenii]
MKKYTSKYLLICLAFNTNLFAQQNFWKTTSAKGSISKEELNTRAHTPTKSAKLDLAYDDLVSYLSNTNQQSFLLKFPTENGKFNTYRISETSNLSPELQAKYPDIKSFSGYNTNDLMEKINFSLSPQFGLYGLVSNANKTVLIDAYTKNKASYIVYDKNDLVNTSSFQCGTEPTENAHGIDNLNFENIKKSSRTATQNGSLRKFRLAITTTTEYSDFVINQANISTGTEAQKKAAILAAVNLSLTRINGVLKNDVGVFLELIPNTDQLFFIDSDSFQDPNINSNSAANYNLSENIKVTNNVIGASNYDIGHLFFKVTNNNYSNGLANTPAVCLDNYKAGGVTGTVTPIGDAFDIDYTAHEIGHQLGAYHTQNNNCNRTLSSSVEPGSGSTIMAYTGICSPNVQNQSNAYFHTKSLEEMTSTLNYVSCGQFVTTANTAPTITSTLKTEYNVPISTAFALETAATDSNNDQLTYSWEQMNPEVSNYTPPISSNTQGPNFRSFSPQKVGIRYFPRLEKIISNELVFQTNPYLSSVSDYAKNNWEVIPSTPRTMNFSVTVRDNNSEVGLTTRQNVKLNFLNFGPFKVTSQTTTDYWTQNYPATITWDVAGTDANGIDTENVKILLSVDGGKTFDYVLAESVPNNGKYDFTVPSNVTLTKEARIMIKAIDNVFLAVSAANFEISDKLATSEINSKDLATISPNPSNGIINLDFTKSFTSGKITVTDLAGRTVYSNTLNSSKSQQVNLSNLSNGVYIVSIEAGNEQFAKKVIIKK